MDKYELYDTAISRACINLNSLAIRNDGKIFLKGFNPKDSAHLCILKCAEIVYANLEGISELIVEDGFWKHLFAPKWVRKHKRARHLESEISVDDFIDFTLTGLNGLSFSGIYEEYYK